MHRGERSTWLLEGVGWRFEGSRGISSGGFLWNAGEAKGVRCIEEVYSVELLQKTAECIMNLN